MEPPEGACSLGAGGVASTLRARRRAPWAPGVNPVLGVLTKLQGPRDGRIDLAHHCVAVWLRVRIRGARVGISAPSGSVEKAQIFRVNKKGGRRPGPRPLVFNSVVWPSMGRAP
jgi:hypothetical protein